MTFEAIPLYIAYIAYYALFPLIIISLVWIIFKKRNFILGTIYFGGKEDKSPSALKENLKDLKKLQVYLVVTLLLLMPLLNSTFFWLADETMDRKRVFRGEGSYIDRPVESQIGPTFDIEKVIERMEEDDHHWEDWLLEDIRDEIDFDEITRLPGRLGVYYLRRAATRENHVIITYSYLSPIPITIVYGFNVVPEQEIIFLLEGPDTLIYPMDPADVDPF